MQATLQRTYNENQTIGTLTLRDAGRLIFQCHTLELPWKNNQRQVSCIPEGSYQVVPRVSAKLKRHFYVEAVPGRSYILIHPGTYTNDTQGCILLGSAFKDVNADGLKDIVNSRITMAELIRLAPDGFNLTITR